MNFLKACQEMRGTIGCGFFQQRQLRNGIKIAASSVTNKEEQLFADGFIEPTKTSRKKIFFSGSWRHLFAWAL